MSMTVNKRRDTETAKVFTHKVADIRGGVSVSTSELGGSFLNEGAVVTAPTKGICHVVKVARIAQQSTGTSLKVVKGHNFKVGDIVASDKMGAAVTITAVDRTLKTFDKIEVDSTLGELDSENFIVEAASVVGSKAKLKYVPFAVVGTTRIIEPNSNLSTDAWVIGVTQNNPLPTCVSEKLKNIVNY